MANAKNLPFCINSGNNNLKGNSRGHLNAKFIGNLNPAMGLLKLRLTPVQVNRSFNYFIGSFELRRYFFLFQTNFKSAILLVWLQKQCFINNQQDPKQFEAVSESLKSTLCFVWTKPNQIMILLPLTSIAYQKHSPVPHIPIKDCYFHFAYQF